MSKKDHNLKNQLKKDAHDIPPHGGSRTSGPSANDPHPTSQNELAGTPLNPREQGQGHQRQPKP